jgi:sugar/nucleoside kinase (ribokinase family)
VRDFDLLIVGDCNADLVVTANRFDIAFDQVDRLVDGARLVLGGSASITAAGAARLGLRTAFVGVVGDDPVGRFVLDSLVERGVNIDGCVVDPSVPTGVSVILSEPGRRAVLTAPGTIDGLTADMIDGELVAAARHVHAASVFMQPRLRAGLAALFARTRAGGATTSLDPQGDPAGAWPSLADVLRTTDILLLNGDEDRRIDSSSCPLVIVKQGGEGAVARTPAGEMHAPAFPVATVDAIGAGDSFDAGYLAGHLNGLPPDQALRLAVACGSLSTRAAGGTAAQPTMEEARSLL